jgi:pathogenesis-related protein 1
MRIAPGVGAVVVLTWACGGATPRPEPGAAAASPLPQTEASEPVGRPAPAPATSQAAPTTAAPLPADAPTPSKPAPAPAAAVHPIVAAHNAYRARHCAAALQWSDELAAVSQAWADRLAAKGCVLEHNPRSAHGENLAFFGPPGTLTAEEVAKMWYDEQRGYDYQRARFSFATGHFTQLVWRDTRAFGCGQVVCNGGELWVCSYAPAGNVQGQFMRNVLPTTCR